MIKNFVDGVLTASDGTTPTPLDLVVPYCNGDFSASGINAEQAEHSVYMSRGAVVGLRHTNFKPITGSFSIMVDEFTDGTLERLTDLIMGTGVYAARVSTSADIGDVPTLGLVFTSGTGATMTLSRVYFELDTSEGDPNTITFNFTSYAPAVFS